MSNVIPELAVADLQRSLDFYTSIGFTKEADGVIDEKGSQWCSLTMGDAQLWLIREDIIHDISLDGAKGNGVNIYISVDDADAVYNRVKQSAPIVRDIETMYYGKRHFSVQDPDGYLLSLIMDAPVEEGAAASG